jgi:TonB family protein
MLSLLKYLYRTIERIQVVRPRCFGKLSMTVFLLSGYWSACGQQPVPRVYTYVEQMPELPSGGGMATVVMELFKQLKLPKQAIEENYGRAMIYFEVDPIGAVQHTQLLHSSGSASLDKALLAAAKSLPHFIPGRQHGRVVTVSMTLPITCIKPQ